MCRYGFKNYKPHYVCFDCRKTFKQPILEEIVIQNGDWEAYKRAFLNYNSDKSKQFRNNNPELISKFDKKYRNKKYPCPNCGSEMNNIGLDFKAPKNNKIKEWRIAKSLYKIGNTFHTCGCDGPGYIPRNLTDHLNNMYKISAVYQKKLNQRNIDFSPSELKEYLFYWKSKLDLISAEINKLKTK